MKNLFTTLANRYMTNRNQTLTNAYSGFQVLHQILTRMDKQLESTKRESLVQEMMAMRCAVADVIELAYADWKGFTQAWELDVYFHDDAETSNIFVFYFNEKKGERQYHFRFTGL
jgi:hypothetical protein